MQLLIQKKRHTILHNIILCILEQNSVKIYNWQANTVQQL